MQSGRWQSVPATAGWYHRRAMSWRDPLRRVSRWPERPWAPLVLLLVGALGYGLVSGARLFKQSSDPHFVYQADAWLNGKLAIDPPPPKGDDWAMVETVVLQDGRTVRGRRMTSAKYRGWFRTTRGDEIPLGQIERSLGKTHYVSFPPAPALLMLPQTLIHGRRANDVVPTVLVAALILPLGFLTLRRLARAGLSDRSAGEDAWLAIGLGFGTVLFFSAVQGRVWFTAHVVGVFLSLGYVWGTIEARRPMVAGLCLGLAAVTRTPMAFMFPLFLWEAWRVTGPDQRKRFVVLCAKMAAPVLIIAILAAIFNYTRFDNPLDFGHPYLSVVQQARMEEFGLFDYDYLSRNLTVALTLLPRLSGEAPYVQISGHGMALWLTTPLILFVVWPRVRGPWHRAVWLSVALVAVPSLFYQNSGFFQFGYRFALDYMALLFVLIAVGGRPLGRLGRALIVVAIVINLFGAVTFGRHHEYYQFDRNVIIRH